jgi:hypothetical protein
VYVLRDERGTAAKGGEPPAWLANGFIKLDEPAEVSDEEMGSMVVYRSGMAMSGQITLGGNADPPSQVCVWLCVDTSVHLHTHTYTHTIRMLYKITPL